MFTLVIEETIVLEQNVIQTWSWKRVLSVGSRYFLLE